jgi:hypothetical protein
MKGEQRRVYTSLGLRLKQPLTRPFFAYEWRSLPRYEPVDSGLTYMGVKIFLDRRSDSESGGDAK